MASITPTSPAAPSTPPANAAAPPSAPAGEGGLFAGMALDRPMDAIPMFLTNVAERISGVHDERYGYALAHGAMAFERIATAVTRVAGSPTGIVGGAMSVAGKAINVLGIGMGAVQVIDGWQELRAKGEGPLGLLHSKAARGGLLQIAAGALMFVPTPLAALAGAGLMMVSVANDVDMFKQLDTPAPLTNW